MSVDVRFAGVAASERNILIQNFQDPSRIQGNTLPKGKFLEPRTFFKECQ
jgi:hypothetical protein